jgi:hypothetical protein
MGAALGADLGSTRVHTDGLAAESARALSAEAYSVGDHVVFGAGRFAPGTREGDRLLAHELTHVVQASGGGLGGAGVRRQFVAGGGTAGAAAASERAVVSSPRDAAEVEAAAVADRLHGYASGIAEAPVSHTGAENPISRPRAGAQGPRLRAVIHRQDTGQRSGGPSHLPPPGAFGRGPTSDPFGGLGTFGMPQTERLRFATRFFVDQSLPTICPQCHRETPTPLPEKYIDRDATEPRLVLWGKESEAALHIGFSTRAIQLDPAAVDGIVDDFGVGLVKRVTSSNEFTGSQKVRDEGADTVRRNWPDIRQTVRDKLVSWHQYEVVTAVTMTPKFANPVLRPEHLKAVLASHERKAAPLGRLGGVAVAGQRYGVFVITDINDWTVYFHLPDRPLWLYEISLHAFIKHDPLITETYRQAYENTRWILFVTPFLLKVGAFALGFSGSVLVIIAGIVLDELAEEMERDIEGNPRRSPEEILKSAGTQLLIDRLFHKLAGGGGAAKAAAGVAPELAVKVERMAERAAPLVRKELAEAEKPLVKQALEQGTARRVTDKALVAEGHTLEVAIESAGQSHVFRLGKDGKWCRFSSPVCGLDLGADLVTAAKSPKSLTAGELAETRELMKTIENEAAFLQNVSQRMRAAGKVDVSLLTKEERALLDALAEEGDAAKLTLGELNRMAKSPELGRQFAAAVDQEGRLVKQLYHEGRPLYEVMRAGSPSYKSRSLILREAGQRDAVTGVLPRSGALDVDHVVPLNEIVRMPGFDKLKLDRQLEIVNDVKNLRAIDNLANRSRGDRSWAEWVQALVHYSLPDIARMKALEEQLRSYLAGRITALSRL